MNTFFLTNELIYVVINYLLIGLSLANIKLNNVHLITMINHLSTINNELAAN